MAMFIKFEENDIIYGCPLYKYIYCSFYVNYKLNDLKQRK